MSTRRRQSRIKVKEQDKLSKSASLIFKRKRVVKGLARETSAPSCRQTIPRCHQASLLKFYQQATPSYRPSSSSSLFSPRFQPCSPPYLPTSSSYLPSSADDLPPSPVYEPSSPPCDVPTSPLYVSSSPTYSALSPPIIVSGEV